MKPQKQAGQGEKVSACIVLRVYITTRCFAVSALFWSSGTVSST